MELNVHFFPALPDHVTRGYGYNGRHWGVVTEDGFVLVLYDTEREARERVREHLRNEFPRGTS